MTGGGAPSPSGRLEGLRDGRAVGWLVLPGSTARRVVVEALADGVAVACGFAHGPDPDGWDDGAPDRLQFSLPLAGVRPGATVTARLANTGMMLPGQLSMPAPTGGADGPKILGIVERVLEASVQGWICNAHDLAERRGVAVTDAAGRVLAQGRADRYRGDVEAAGVGDGRYGFRLPVPPAYLDGQEHVLRCIDTATGTELQGSPLTVSGPPGGSSLFLADLLHTLDTLPAERLRAGLTLLLGQARRNDRIHPASVPFADHANWDAAFGRLISDRLPADGRAPDVTALVVVEAAEGLPRTLAALRAQDHPPVAVLQGAAEDLPHLLAGVTTDKVAVVRAGDHIRPQALRLVSHVLDGAPACFADGLVEALPWFKPGWSEDLALAQDYTEGVIAFRRGIVPGLEAAESAFDLPFLLGATGGFTRIPEVLYETARDPCTGGDQNARMAAARRHLARRGAAAARVEPLAAGASLRRVHWPRPASAPRVSIIIPTRDRLELLRPCVESIAWETAYRPYEILIVDNGSRDAETLAYLERGAREGRFRVLRDDGPFNFAALNNRAAEAARGEILAFVNNDTELLSGDWLGEAVSLLARPEVGAVGARLRFRNGMIQHYGVVLGVGGLAENAFQHLSVDDPGYFARTGVPGDFAAVTAACLLCRREVFRAVGGFDAQNLPVGFNDVDFCLRLRERGLRVIATPHIEMIHDESRSRGADVAPERVARGVKEETFMRERWGTMLAEDPFYSPNLTLDRYPYKGLAWPARLSAQHP